MDYEKFQKILKEHALWLNSNKKDGKRANLEHFNLDGDNLTIVGLREANLQEANLRGADLRGANIQGANLREADLGIADLRGADLRGAILVGANLEGVDLQETKLQGATLLKAYLAKTNFQEAELQGANLREAYLYEANLEKADLSGADLSEADLQDTDLQGAEFRKADLRGANFLGANLDQAHLEGADLTGIILEKATVSNLPKSVIEEYGHTFFVTGWPDYVDTENLLIRSIEFPSEYHQAGISILNYFGTVLRKKYPDQKAKVKIEQDDLKVTMIVEPLEGDREVIEKALNEYGLVVTGNLAVEEFTDDKLFEIDLKNQLNIAKIQLDMQSKSLEYQHLETKLEVQSKRFELQDSQIKKKDLQIDKLLDIVGQAIQNPPKYYINIPVSSHSEARIIQHINIAKQISLVHGSLNELREQLKTGSEEAKTIQGLQDSLEKIDQSKPPKEVAESPAMSKFRRFLEDVDKAETTAGKVIKTTRDGIDIARKLAGYYNEIAQWCGLPQVPKPFTKK